MTSAPEMAFDPAPPDGSKQYMAYPDHHRPLSQVVDSIKDLAAHVHPPVPNPAPLGLIAFGLTTGLLMIKHTRIAGEDQEDLHGVNTVLLGFALFFGGLLQVRAGSMLFFPRKVSNNRRQLLQ
jgi:GPR1/FUN34/yaaH family